MTRKKVVGGASTHFNVLDDVKVPGFVSRALNHQSDMELLIDPQDDDNVRTHSTSEPVFKGSKRAPVAAAIRDEERTGPLDVHGIDNDVDPSIGYLEKESGMEVIDVPLYAADEEFEDEDSEDELNADEDEFEADDEFVDEEVESNVDDEFVDEEVESNVDSEFGDLSIEADEGFEDIGSDGVAIADADEIADQVDSEELQFATVANAVHVIRANRILASIGLANAKRAGIADVYLTPQYQDVVVANIEEKGLRKGLVQSGFVLAKVAINASKHTATAVKARVEAAVNNKLEVLAKQQKAMDQALAIAAVGINRRFFKDVSNDLKTNLEAELVQAGVRGGQNIVRAMFAQYGVSYAKSILTLANKIAAMPEEMRNQYADALDMTEDEDYSDVDSVEADIEEDEEDFDPIPASVVAALNSPVRKSAALLTAGVKSSSAMRILSGTQSLV